MGWDKKAIVAEARTNMKYKSVWMEMSGALGDLGTFIPIVVALALANGLDLGTTLIFTGAYNIITGIGFGVPMPVQPMKTIAAVAISERLTLAEIMAAGIMTSAVLTGLGITGLMHVVQKLVPLPVVRGIQLSQGLSFAITGVKYVIKNQNFATGKSKGDREWMGTDGMLVALLTFCFIVVVGGSGPPPPGEDEEADVAGQQQQQNRRPLSTWRRWFQRVPTAIIVFIVGLVLAFIRKPSVFRAFEFGPAKPRVYSHITAREWRKGFVSAAIPQLPLSVLNSVVAVCKLAGDLYPEKSGVVSPTKVSVSVGLMNLVGCWFGAMPACHGAGGLAGQWRFGARSGAAVVFLGGLKLLLGLLLGSSMVRLLDAYPVGILGVLLFYAGLELAMACRDQTSRAHSFVVISSAAMSIATSSAAIGFVFSLGIHILFCIPDMTPKSVSEKIRRSIFRRDPPPPAPAPTIATV